MAWAQQGYAAMTAECKHVWGCKQRRQRQWRSHVERGLPPGVAVASLGVPSRQQPLGEVQAGLPPAGLAGVAAVVAAAGDALGLAPATTGVGEAPVDTAGAVGLGLVLVVFEAPAKESVPLQPRQYLDSLHALAQAAQGVTAERACCLDSAVSLSRRAHLPMNPLFQRLWI